MKCPVCKLKLIRKTYEDVLIHACARCQGTLVQMHRLQVIESRRIKDEDQLTEELINAREDNPLKIRCPKCFWNMEKQTKRIGASLFSTDVCQKCKHVWLDAGELAKLQIMYEYSEQGTEALRFKQRLNNMTAAEKQEMEDRIAKLPERSVGAEDADIFDNLRRQVFKEFFY